MGNVFRSGDSEIPGLRREKGGVRLDGAASITNPADQLRCPAGRPSVDCEAHELWSSKGLTLLWNPPSGLHNPCLLGTALPGAAQHPASQTDPRRKGGTLQWFWRVDLTFGAWVCRACRRAEHAKADLPAHERRAVVTVLNYLKELHPGCLEGLEARALSPVVLPGSDIIPRAAELAKFGLGPRWDGWEKFVAETPDEPTQTPQPAKSATRPRRPEKPGMFD